MRNPSGVLVIIGLMLVWTGGCAAPPPQLVPPVPLGATYVFHLPGIAGDSSFDRNWTHTFVETGAARGVQICDWTCGDRWLLALYAVSRHAQQAQRIADSIADHRRSDPSARILVTAESAGCGIAIYALSRLPKDIWVDDVILVSPAVSSRFDLSPALAHVSGNMYYFDSPIDWLTLFCGTVLFGTIDQTHGPGAGLVGFHRPANADIEQYNKLVEIRYNPAWAQWGYVGTHLTGMSSAFARNVIAPMVAGSQTSETLLAANPSIHSRVRTSRVVLTHE